MDENKLRKIWEDMASHSYLESNQSHMTYKESHILDWSSYKDALLDENDKENIDSTEIPVIIEEDSVGCETFDGQLSNYESALQEIIAANENKESSQTLSGKTITGEESSQTLSGKTIGGEESSQTLSGKTFQDDDEDYFGTLSGKTGNDNLSNKNRKVQKDAQDYEIFEEIARGGMGKISKGRQKSLKRNIAIKEILTKNEENESHKQKFISEALVTAYLDHPNIIPVYEIRENKAGNIFLAMKLINGVSWKELLHSKKNLDKTYSFSDHLKILLNVCNAVAFAHNKGIVHNDLKPDNIMVGKFGEVFVMDWGIAVDIGDEKKERRTLHKSEINKPMGTPSYIPIELAEGNGNDIGYHTDVYLLGGILYEIITGKPPHAAETVWLSLLSCREENVLNFPRGISQEIQDICSIALSRDIDERFQTVKEFQEALEGYLQHRESATIAEEAKNILEKCKLSVDEAHKKKVRMRETQRNRLYSEFAQSVAYFQQSLMLWDGNAIAHKYELQARHAYAEFALLNGDLGLAEAQAELLKVNEHSQLSSILLKVQKAKNNKLRHERRYRSLRYMLLMAIIFILVGLTLFTVSLNEEKKQTELQREEAAKQREFAFNRRNEAINKAEEARYAKEEVEKYADRLEEQKQKIAEEAQQAKATLAQIALQKASEAYDNAQWKNCGIYAGLGLELLKEYNNDNVNVNDLRTQNTSFIRLSLEKESLVWKTTPGYAKHIHSLIFIPEKKLLITAARDREIRCWDATTGKETYSLQGHTDEVYKIIYDKKSNLLISASRDRTIRFWSLDDYKSLGSIYCDNFDVHSLAYSDNLLAVGSDAKVIFIRNNDGVYKIVHQIDLDKKTTIRALKFTTDSKFLLIAHKKIEKIEIGTGKTVSILERENEINSFAYFEENDIIATAEGKDIFFWKLRANKNKLIKEVSHDSEVVNFILFEQNYLVASSAAKTLRVWDLQKGTFKDINIMNSITSIAYDEQENMVFVATGNGVLLLDPKKGEFAANLPMHTAAITSVAYNASGDKVASASDDRSIRIWDTHSGKNVSTFYGHARKISSLAFHPKKDLLASASHDRSMNLWELDGKQYPLAGHNDDITNIACHPDGLSFASGAKDYCVNVWEIPSGKQKYVLKGHSGAITALIYNSNGSLIASGGADKNICIWASSTGTKLFTLKGHEKTINKLAFHPNGKFLASGGDDNLVIVWSLETGDQVAVFKGHERSVISLLFSSDGRTLLSGSKDKKIHVWDLQQKKWKDTLTAHNAWVTDLQNDPSGKYFASVSSDSNIIFWKYDNKEHKKFAHATDISSLDFHKNKSIFASAAGRSIYIWDANGTKIFELKGHSSWIKSVAFRPNSNELASCSSDKTICIWDAVMGRKIKQLDDHQSDVNSLFYTPDGRYMVSTSKNNILIWDASRKTILNQILSGHTQQINDIKFSPNEKTLASVSNDNSLRIWDLETQKVIQVFEGHNAAINALSYSPKGNYIATASSDKSIRIWDLERGKTIFVLFGHEGEVQKIAYNPSGNAIATSSTDKTVRIWNVATGKPTLTLENMKGVNALKYSKDGRILTIALANNNIELWDIGTGKRVDSLTGHTFPVVDIDYSPDGKKIVSGSEDSTMRLWTIPNSIDVSFRKGHDYRDVNDIACDPNSKRFASVGNDHKIYIWDTQSTKPIATSLEQKSPLLSIVYSPDGKEIVCGSKNGEIIVWDNNLNYLYSFKAHQSHSRAVYNKNSLLASFGEDQQIHLWKRKQSNSTKYTHSKEATLTGHDAEITSLHFSPDGKTLASSSKDRTVRLWDVETQKQKIVFSRHKAVVNAVVFSNDSTILASASDDETIRLWDVQNMKQLRILEGHKDAVISIAFSSDNTYLISSSKDENIIVWDVITGKIISHYPQYNAVATKILYQLNNRGFITTSTDKIIRIWQVEETTPQWTLETLPMWFKAILNQDTSKISFHRSSFDLRSDIPGYLLEHTIIKAPKKITESLFDSKTTDTFGVINRIPFSLFERK